MKSPPRSILQELNDISLTKDINVLIESRGLNIIQSAINLLESIKHNCSPEHAADLEKRFINSIKSGDPAKFKRGIVRARESKRKP